uniref:Uncharacterized protein n=1 Tax=Arundo donax TaxID=35708 RepID=A0A0A9A0T2_ARUDO
MSSRCAFSSLLASLFPDRTGFDSLRRMGTSRRNMAAGGALVGQMTSNPHILI